MSLALTVLLCFSQSLSPFFSSACLVMFTIYSDLVHNRTLRTIWYKKNNIETIWPSNIHTHHLFLCIFIYRYFFICRCQLCIVLLFLYVLLCMSVCVFTFFSYKKIYLFWCFSFDIIFFQNEILYVYAKHKNNIKKTTTLNNNKPPF